MMKIKKIGITIIAITVTVYGSYAQGNTGIGTTTPDGSAKLDIVSTTQGFVMPRMTTVQRLGIAPIAGLEVYDTTTRSHWYHDGTNWVENVTGGSNIDFTDDEWVNNPGAARIELGRQSDGATARTAGTEFVALDNGNLGVGTTAPTDLLDVAGTVRVQTLPAIDGDNSDIVVMADDVTGQLRKVVATTLVSEPWLDVASPGTGATTATTNLYLASGKSITVGTASPTAGKVATFAGDIDVQGVLDPTKLIFSDGTTSSFDPAINDAYEIEFDTRDLRFTNSTAENNLVIKQSGNIGIGTTDPQAKLDVAGLTLLRNGIKTNTIPVINGQGGYFGWNRAGIGRLYLASQRGVGAGGFEFLNYNIDNTLNSIAMTITHDGNVGIGTNAPSARLSVSGTANKTGGGAWAVFSDARSKESVHNYTTGLYELLQLRPVSFNYKENMGWGTKTYVGLIAQEVEKIVPSMVTQKEVNGIKDFREIDPNEITYMLVNAIKELKTENEILKKRLSRIETVLGINKE